MSGSEQLTVKIIYVDEDRGWRENLVFAYGGAGGVETGVDKFPLPRFVGSPS